MRRLLVCVPVAYPAGALFPPGQSGGAQGYKEFCMNKRSVSPSPEQNQTLHIESSPHMTGGASVAHIMWQVNAALLPVIGFAVYAYGLAAVCSVLFALAACVAAEYGYCRWRR